MLIECQRVCSSRIIMIRSEKPNLKHIDKIIDSSVLALNVLPLQPGYRIKISQEQHTKMQRYSNVVSPTILFL